MRLKTITAPDPAQALRQVRALLGVDAIILATQELREGGVRVTAAVESDDLDLADLLAPAPARPGEPPTWLNLLARHHGMSNGLVDRLGEALTGQVEREPVICLGHALQSLFRFAPLPPISPRPLLVAGPPGAGKTASIAKLAARAVLARHSVAVLSADVERAGGTAQLSALLAPLGLETLATPDAQALRQTVGQQDAQLILIDTPGLNPFKPADIGQLSSLIEASGGEPILVLPAGLESGECSDIAHTFQALGCDRFLGTRLDAARRLGGLLAAAETGLAWSDVGIGPTIGRGLSPLAATGLARVLMHAHAAVGPGGQTRVRPQEVANHG